MDLDSRSKPAQLLGVLAFVVAVAGYLAFGWRFGGDSNPVALVLALVGVAAAVLFTIRDE